MTAYLRPGPSRSDGRPNAKRPAVTSTVGALLMPTREAIGLIAEWVIGPGRESFQRHAETLSAHCSRPRGGETFSPAEGRAKKRHYWSFGSRC